MYKLYSQRLKESNNKIPDVYEYDYFPEPFRIQIIYILEPMLLDKDKTSINPFNNAFVWKSINLYKKEKGLLFINGGSDDDIEEFLINSSEIDILDFIDFLFYSMYRIVDMDNSIFKSIYTSKFDRLVLNLNNRFKQHNLGYEFSKNQIIRIDNKLIHKEIIKPALMLLNLEEFSGAEEEFRKAFEFRRSGDNKSALSEAAKAFESTMKIICENHNYPFDPQKDTANKLIKILSENSFFPPYMNYHLESLIKTLSSGLPTARNKLSGHGQGSEIVNVSDSFAEYALSLAATNIVLLVNLYKEKNI